MSSFLIEEFKGVEYKKNLSIQLEPDTPSSEGNIFTLDESLSSFLRSYFTHNLESKDNLLQKEDIDNSDFKQELESIFYVAWKYLVRYKEIYLNLEDLSFVKNIFFVTDIDWLNKNICETKYSMCLNLSSEPLIFSYNPGTKILPCTGKLIPGNFTSNFLSKFNSPPLVVLLRLF